MITRRDSLEQALQEIESQTLTGASTIIVNRGWWDSLSPGAQDAYRRRAERVRTELRADNMISTHFVEVRGADEGPPLSTERPM